MRNTIKLVYVTHARLPTEKAHGLATVKLCEAFAKAGIEVELLIPRLWFRREEDIFSFYRIQKKFKVRHVPTIDLGFLGVFEWATYPIRFISFAKIASLYCLWKYKKERAHIIYFSHDATPLFFLSFISKNIFYDIHDVPSNSVFARRVMKKAFGFSVQTKAKIPFLKKYLGIPEEKIVYWPNGTDVSEFMIGMAQEEARKKVGIPAGKKIALYTGQLFGWKGVDTFIQASRFLSEIDFYVVGGTARDVARTKEEVKESRNANVHFISFQPHAAMPLWLKAADVLILPNTGREDISRYWTSPMKLFEYMASGTPIVASRLPSIEEVVDEDTVFFAEPDSPESFARAIQKAIDGGLEKGKRAQEKAARYTWSARAEKIAAHIRMLLV